MSDATKDLKYHMSLPYAIIIRLDDDGDYVAEVQELDGCVAHGATQAEALHNLDEAKEAWIADCLEAGHTVPPPLPEEPLPSGKWVQRVPRTLHRKLAVAAEKEGVSLNQLVTSILSEAVGSHFSVPAELSYSFNVADQEHDLWRTCVDNVKAKFADNWLISQPTTSEEVIGIHVAGATQLLGLGSHNEMKIKMSGVAGAYSKKDFTRHLR